MLEDFFELERFVELLFFDEAFFPPVDFFDEALRVDDFFELLALFFEVARFAVDFFAVDFFVVDFPDVAFFGDAFFDVAFFDDAFFVVAFFVVFFDEDDLLGTLPPSRLASDNPMAMACLRLVTFLPDRPLLSFPCFISCSSS